MKKASILLCILLAGSIQTNEHLGDQDSDTEFEMLTNGYTYRQILELYNTAKRNKGKIVTAMVMYLAAYGVLIRNQPEPHYYS